MVRIIDLELRRNTNKTTFVIVVLFVLFALIINRAGIRKIENLEETKREFIRNETKKVENYNAYSQYKDIGFKVLFLPSGIYSLAHKTAMDFMHASINTGAKLDIDNPRKGKRLFQGGVDLFLLLLTIGSIIVTSHGWGSFRNKEYIKTLLNSGSRLTVYGAVLIAWLIQLILSISLLTAALLVQFYIGGLTKHAGFISDFFIFMSLFTGVMVVFLVLGAIFGIIQKSSKSLIITCASWFILVFLLPNLIDSKFDEKAENSMKPIYSLEAKKEKLIYEFEKAAKDYIKDKEDIFKAVKEFTDKFLNDGEVEKLEVKLLKETEQIVNESYLLNVISPVTFLRSAINELSSSGYNEYLRFYGEIIKKKKEFIKFYLEKGLKPGKVVPFLSGDEYIFHAKPSLPAYFWLGVFVLFSWIVFLSVVGFYFFKRTLCPRQERAVDFKGVELNIKRGNYLTIEAQKPRYLADQIFSILSGKPYKGFTGKITLDGKEITKTQEIFYLPEYEKFPDDLKVKQLEKLAGLPGTSDDLFKDLEEIEKAELYIKLAAQSKRNIVLMPDLYFRQINEKDRKKIADQLKKLKGKTVIEIMPMTGRSRLYHELFDFLGLFYFKKDTGYKMTILKE